MAGIHEGYDGCTLKREGGNNIYAMGKIRPRKGKGNR